MSRAEELRSALLLAEAAARKRQKPVFVLADGDAVQFSVDLGVISQLLRETSGRLPDQRVTLLTVLPTDEFGAHAETRV